MKLLIKQYLENIRVLFTATLLFYFNKELCKTFRSHKTSTKTNTKLSATSCMRK